MADLHEMYALDESQYDTDVYFQAVAMKLRAFIFPSVPRHAFEIEAFNKAVLYEIQHELNTQSAMGDKALPEGLQSFSIGDFSASFSGDGSSTRLTRRSICQMAYGLLLEAGLMYKGVEGRL